MIANTDSNVIPWAWLLVRHGVQSMRAICSPDCLGYVAAAES